MARASGQTAAQHWKSKPGRGRKLSLVPAGTTALSSCTCRDRAPPRHPFSPSSACHVHPADRPPQCRQRPEADHDLEAAYRAHRTSLFHFLRRKAGAEEAPDLVQEVFARAAGSEQRNQLTNPGGFLRRIAQNLLIDRARRQKSSRATFYPLRDEGEGATPAAQEWDLEAADLLRLYEAAVDALPPKTRRVFLMHRVDELSYREIHEALGISIATVEYHMMRALAQISKVVDSGR